MTVFNTPCTQLEISNQDVSKLLRQKVVKGAPEHVSNIHTDTTENSRAVKGVCERASSSSWI